jgi:predicted dehydrogenase
MVNSVKAESKKLYSKEVEDELTADINFVNGINVHFDTSWSKEAYRKSYAKLEIFGTNGKMVVTDQTLDIFDNDDESILNLTYPDLYGGAYMDVGGVLYSNQMQHFIDMLDKKSELKSNLFDAVYDQKIIEKIYESAERKEIVTIEER